MRAILMAFFFFGCSTPTDARYGAELTERDWQVIGEALDTWCDQTSCCPSGVPVTVVTADECERRVGYPCDGYEDVSGIGLVVENFHTYSHLRSVAMHEFGHACGCAHSDDPSDVMHSPSMVDTLSTRDKECPQ